MSTELNKLPLPDPWNTSVGLELLECKKRLNTVLEAVKLNFEPKELRKPKEILEDDLKTHMNELDEIWKKIEKNWKVARNKPVVDQCLMSVDAVREKIAEAQRQLWSALIPVDAIHSSTENMARQMEGAVELDKAIRRCCSALDDTISQFRK